MVSLVASVIFGGGNLKAQETTTVSDGVRSAEIVKSADGKKLVVTANGDLKDLKCANGEKTFTADAVNNVFVDANGTKTSVKSGDKYSSETTYYLASIEYTPLTIAEANKVTKKVYSFTQKAFDAPLYLWSADVEDYVSYKATPVTKGDTPYKVGNYDLTSRYTQDNLAKGQWDSNSYFRVANEGASAPYTDGNTRILTAQALEDEGYVTSQVATVLVNLTGDIYKSTDGGKTYVAVSNGDIFNENATYYKGETIYSELADATSYTENVIVSFAEYLPTLMEGVTSATFTSVDKNNPSMIDNPIVWALLNTQVRILDLSGVKIPAIVSPYIDGNYAVQSEPSKATFILGKDKIYGNENLYLETLYTPQVNNGGILEYGVLDKLKMLRYLHISEGVQTLGVDALKESNIHLSVLTFPNTLEYIKSNACAGHYSTDGHGGIIYNKVYNEETGKYGDKDEQWIQTLVFPSGLKEIEKDAFAGMCPKDVYFLGEEAPKVAKYAWGDNAYIANNALTPTIKEGTGKDQVTVALADGHASRNNYIAQSGWQTMLHYPRTCTKAQAAKYTDVTREYRIVGEKNGESWSAGKYTPGKETVDLSSNSSGLQATAYKTFERSFDDAWDQGRYQGGYPDMYTGEQYLWPSMAMAQRATIVAQNDVLWDGITTIGVGIRNEGGDYSSDGSEYIGLHQFVLAKGDAEPKSTPEEFPMDKYADGEWHTICLPFNMTKGQMKEIFGRAEDDVNGEYNNIRLCKFSNVIRKNDGENAYLKLCFNDEVFHDEALTDDDVVLKAHVSYMIKAKKENAVEGQKVVMTGYEMQPGNPIPTCIIADEKGGTMSDRDEYSYRFIGTYLPNIYMPQYTYFFSKNYKRFRFQGGTTGKWNPYTSVVEAPLGVDDDTLYFGGAGVENPAKMFTGLGELSDEVTGVEKVTIEAGDDVVYTNGNVYNLNGQLVSKNGTNGLAKGIYVVNGKKVLVK